MVEFVSATDEPARICSLVASQTVRQEAKEAINSESLIRFCYKARHMSVFEPVYYSARLTGVSRAFMAQITRHRHFSFMCSSQHYQDYRDYPIIGVNDSALYDACSASIKAYEDAVNRGVPVWEARMVLPEAMGVNMFMSGNARAWAEMLNKRLCYRNVPEMIRFARQMRVKLNEWFPELFTLVGPDCAELGHCTQGKMSCGGIK